MYTYTKIVNQKKKIQKLIKNLDCNTYFKIRVTFIYYILHCTKTYSRNRKANNHFKNNHNVYIYTKLIKQKKRNPFAQTLLIMKEKEAKECGREIQCHKLQVPKIFNI